MENKDFRSPPNIFNLIKRFPEVWTDPASNQLSASRLVIFFLGIVVSFISVYETVYGRSGNITTMLTAVFASCAGIYFGSTVKDWRWRKRDREENRIEREENRREREE